MIDYPIQKYKPFPMVDLKNRTWPNKTLTHAPIWCSSDLRDGNQSLIEPMGSTKKKELFKTLVSVGFKEIEVAFPAASNTDFRFVRDLIEEKLIPDDVWIQVLVQAREDLIPRTFEALKGAKKVILHFYNATSPLFRDVVFKTDKKGSVDLAIKAAKLIHKTAQEYPETEWRFEYSPETFSATELDFAKEICEAVLDVWKPTPEHKAILNLPATVEHSMPNIYADQIEWFCSNLKNRESVEISLHTHNDRGCAVASTEMGLLAGGDRVEGCLFGNGERTGNVDIITLALNLYTQGVEPNLRFNDIDEIRRVYEDSTGLPVHPRHPYAGDLVFTAFSGSHQDAIKKGFVEQEKKTVWNVPYLAIDPRDLGRSYDAVIRVNSQSGKGGISYLLEKDFGIVLPRRLQIDFSQVVQKVSDNTGKEVTSEHIWKIFEDEYLNVTAPYTYKAHRLADDPAGSDHVAFTLDAEVDGKIQTFRGLGEGPIEALVDSLPEDIRIMDYNEHAIGSGATAKAISFVEIRLNDGPTVYGVGIDRNIITASVKATLSGVNRSKKA